ncbi:MAG: type II toxin-antitoxin system HicB family antitoxin [FCB group bacterium]|jgi:antitoxin HicB
MNYPLIIYPASEGGFVAEIISFPGCLTQGETYQECLEEMEVVSKLWVEEYLKTHKSLPNVQKTVDKLLEFNKIEFA